MRFFSHALSITIIVLAASITGIVTLSGAEMRFEKYPGTKTIPQQITSFKKSATIPIQKNCGKQKINPSINGPTLNRIINGKEAIPNSWPWTVSLRPYKNWMYGHFCGGVLISSQYVLTAAHCLADLKSYFNLGFYLTAVVGIHSSNVSSINASNVYFVSTYAYNSKYNDTTLNNDIGIVKLKFPVVLSNRVGIVCLPSSPKNSTNVLNKSVVLAGWGSVTGSPNSRPSITLQQTVLRVLNNKSFCKNYNSDFNSTISYCALADNRNSNACYFDSGSALMYYTNGSWYSYGIVSAGIVNDITYVCNQTLPSYYTQIPTFLSWIGTAMANL